MIKTELAANDPRIKFRKIVQFCAVASFENMNEVKYVKGTIAKGYSSKSVQLSGKSKLKIWISKIMKPDTIRVLSKSNARFTSQYAVFDIPWISCICFSFRSFSWHMKAIEEACIKA